MLALILLPTYKKILPNPNIVEQSSLRNNNNKGNKSPWLVIFQTELCKPCRQARLDMELLLFDENEQLNKDGNLRLGSIDATKNLSSRKRFGIHEIPTVIYIDNDEGIFYTLHSHIVDRTALIQFLLKIETIDRNDEGGRDGKLGNIEGIPIPPAPGLLQRTLDFIDAVNDNVRAALGRGLYSVGFMVVVWFVIIGTIGGVMRCYLCWERVFTERNYLWNTFVYNSLGVESMNVGNGAGSGGYELGQLRRSDSENE